MSTQEPPRQRAVAIQSVKALRQDQQLADELYQDTTTPSDPADRQRIYSGNISDFRGDPAGLAVLPIATGSTARGHGVFSKTYLTQISVIYTESTYEARTSLSMYAVRDRADDVLSSSPAAGMIPTGPEGGDSISTEEGGSRTLVNRFRMVINAQEY